MKAFSQIFVTMGFVAMLFNTLQAQPGPCLYIGPAETSCPSAANLPGLPKNTAHFGMENIHEGLDTVGLPDTIQPRYKAFWIFGDGNFRYFPPNLDYAGDIATLSETYIFPRGRAVYTTEVVLTEKKSNTTPPPGIQRPVAIPPLDFEGKTTPPYDEPDTFVVRINGQKTMDIFNSEYNRPDYPTAFVVSAPANDTEITKIFFLFNKIRIGETGSFQADTLHHMDSAYVNLPNYFENQSVTIQNTDGLSSGLYEAGFFDGARGYQNFAEVAVTDNVRKGIPNTFSEIRFFPILKSVWQNDWIQPDGNDEDTLPDILLPVSRYLAVSAGPSPLYTDNSPNTPEKDAFISLVKTHFPDLTEPEFQISDSLDLYIRGIQMLDVEMVASVDPNNIQTLKFCPKGDGRYEVLLRLEICNEGYMHEKNIEFGLIDHTKLLSEPVFFSGSGITPSPTPNLSAYINSDWKYEWTVFLEAVPLPQPDASAKKLIKPDSSCAHAFFKVETNWRGVQAIVDGKALELCVKFKYGPPKCTFNSPLSSNKEYCREAGYNCGDCPKVVSPENCCNWIFYGLILLVLILLVLIWILWYLLKKKKKN